MIDLTKQVLCSQCDRPGTTSTMVLVLATDSWLCGKCAEEVRKEALALKAKLLEAAK